MGLYVTVENALILTSVECLPSPVAVMKCVLTYPAIIRVSAAMVMNDVMTISARFQKFLPFGARQSVLLRHF